MQDNGEKYESGPAAADEAGIPRKRSRDYSAPQSYPPGQFSNGSAAARGQQSQAPGCSAHTSDHDASINRPEGQNSSAASTKAAERPQDSPQAAVAELRRLKEKIARQEAKMQREQVEPALSCWTSRADQNRAASLQQHCTCHPSPALLSRMLSSSIDVKKLQSLV